MDKTKVLGILGSPRKNGNTDILLDEFLKGAASKGAVIEKIYVGDMNFKGCIECNGCDDTGICVLKDDMTPIYQKLKDADVVAVASPIFFANITAQLKAIIDRCQSEWIAKYILKLPLDFARGRKVKRQKAKGIFICASGHDKDIFFKNAKKTIDVFFKTMNIKYAGDLFFGGVDKPGDIRKVKGAFKKAYKLGQKSINGK